MGYQQHDWVGRYELLTTLESTAIKSLVKFLSALAISYLFLTSLRDGDSLSLKIWSYELAVPVAYFLATTSFLSFLCAIAFCHTSVAMSLKAKEGGKILLSGFSTSIYSLIKKPENEVSLGIPLFSNYFLKEAIPISSVIALFMLVGVFSTLIPFAAILMFICREEFILLQNSEVNYLERTAVGAGLALTVFSAVSILLFHLPMPMRKNMGQIRWSFLCHLPDATRHPQIDRWLDDNNRDN